MHELELAVVRAGLGIRSKSPGAVRPRFGK